MTHPLDPITSRFPEYGEIFETFADLLLDPLFIVSADEELIACNQLALEATQSESLDALFSKCDARISTMFVKEAGYFTPDKVQWMAPLGEGMPMVLLPGREHPHSYRLKVQGAIFSEQTLYFVLLHDIEELQKAKKAQSYFETFKQQFLTNISHEFRTPMNSIIGFSGLLEQTKIDVLQREYIMHIQTSASAMLENVENLLELMQIESGVEKINRDPFPLYAEFENFLRPFCQIAAEKKIAVYFMIDPHLPEQLIGDVEKIKRIMRNLISNAMKFTSAGGQVLVEIKARELGRKTIVVYSITDTGEGIPKEKLQTLLRPFASTRENQIRGKEGFGVGLALSFKLLKMMGSELSVASEVGKGSRFSFTLRHPMVSPAPFKLMEGSKMAIWCEESRDVVQAKILKKYLKLFKVEATEIAELHNEELRAMDGLFIISHRLSKPQLESVKDRYPNLHIVPVVEPRDEDHFLEAQSLIEAIITLPIMPMRLYKALNVIWKKVPKELLKPEEKGEEVVAARRILVAEDNPINQKLITTILGQQGYDVTTAENGQIAVDFYEQDTGFDIILMDIDMPVMDGITATRVIKEIDRRDKRLFTPVIALTARAMAGDREKILSAGLDAHLSKPVDREFLLQTLDQFLKMKDQRNKMAAPR